MTRVRVHFHLTRRTFVISERTDKGWRVARYTDAVCLSAVRFVCSAKGRDYCRTYQNANGTVGARFVHAWAEGVLDSCDDPRAGTDVVYNPFKHDGFTDGSQLITTADHASFTVGGGPERTTRFAVTRCSGVAS